MLLATCLLFVLLLPLLAHPALASSVVPPQNLGALAQMSDGVVLARADAADAKAGGDLIYTRTTFTVLEIIGGDFSVGAQIDVDAYGGELNGIGFAVPGSPEFEAGEVYLLFLSKQGEVWQPRMLSYGLLQQVVDAKGKQVLTHLGALHDVELITRKDGTVPEPIGTYFKEPLLAHLRDVMAQRISWNAATVSAPPITLHHDAAKANGIPEPCTYFINGGAPARWSAFDEGIPLVFYAASNGDNDVNSNAEFEAVENGINTWRNISGASIDWTYGGPLNYTSTCDGGSGTPGDLFEQNEDGTIDQFNGLVQYNDPCNEINDLTIGPNGCGGTLAVGGTFFTTETENRHIHRETPWNTNVIGFVIFNNAVGACFSEQIYELIMTHELGHALGLGHIPSEAGAAIMNPSCCNDVSILDETCALYPYSNESFDIVPTQAELTTPQDGATDLRTPVELSWALIPQASRYHLQVATDASFNNLVHERQSLASNEALVGPLSTGAMYHWRVRAVNTAGQGPWSESRSFSVRRSTPVAVQLTAPNDAAEVTRPVAFQWSSVDDTDRYHIQVSTNAGFSNRVFEASDLRTTATSLDGLDTGFMYYWRVRGSNPVGEGAWSEVRTFTVQQVLPGAVTLIAPENATDGVPVTLNLQWNSDASSAHYHVQVASDGGFDRLVFEHTSLTQTSVEVGPLAKGTTHFWRVRGTNPDGNGIWSAPRSFTTIRALPSRIVLTTPFDHAAAQPSTVSFAWQSAVGADRYHLQVATDAGFNDLVFEDAVLTSTTQSFGPLAYSTTHYWRVRGTNPVGVGPWSDVRSFEIAVGTAIEHSEEVPAHFALHATYPNPFNPQTTLRFDVPNATEVSVEVFDVQGRLVDTLADGFFKAGRYTYTWEAGDLPSGTYLIRLHAGDFVQTQQAVLVK